MNKSYKSVWNESTGTYVAASEVARSRGKSSVSKKALVIAMLMAGAGASLDAEANSGIGTNLGGCANTDLANGAKSIAISSTNSPCTDATGIYATAIGASATASGTGSGTSLGGQSSATGFATGSYQTALGYSASAIASYATAIGNASAAKGVASLALGNAALASANSSFAAGDTATATATGAVALGALTSASGTSAVALGTSAVANQQNAMALGVKTTASATGAVALGNAAVASQSNAVALGANSVADRADTVSVGSTTATRQIVNVAAGSQATDAVNVGQLQQVGIKIDSSGYVTNTFVAYDDMTKGSATLGGASGTTLSNVKAGVAATDAVNVSQLQSEDAKINAAGGNTAAALGGGSTYDSATGAISAPTYKVAGGTQHDVGTALSSLNSATVQFNGAGGAADVKGNKIVNVAAGVAATDAVNMSQLQSEDKKIDTAGGNAATALGGGAAYSASTGTISAPTYNVAGGTQHDVGTALSSLNSATVQFNGAGGAADVKGNKIVNVAAGTVSASSMDAVNGSQLYKTNQDVAANSDAITKNTDAIAQNADAITKNADAIDNVASSVSDITKQLDSGEVGLVQQDQTTRNLTVGAATDGLQISMAGTAGNRVVTGVAAGALSDSSSDAVNGSQLYKTNQDVAANSDAITKNADAIDNVASSVTDITKQLDGGGLGLVQQDQTTRNLTVGAATDGLQISMAGTAGNRVVTGVAAGALSDSSSDAVNGSQLYKT
ncbi:ESPR-type extended signal peptide-containing protein, partial [Paraburkholderia sp. GAS32]|uniref:ESPR-type extended signal peptide-containing protein n=1 Tax=Paraburkholderia sp. GAS32 TaxID=3035129 RepID=UPI003D1FBB90